MDTSYQSHPNKNKIDLELIMWLGFDCNVKLHVCSGSSHWLLLDSSLLYTFTTHKKCWKRKQLSLN